MVHLEKAPVVVWEFYAVRLFLAASIFSARAAAGFAAFSISERKPGFSSAFARSPSWYAIARQARAAVARPKPASRDSQLRVDTGITCRSVGSRPTADVSRPD
jgi:hypothetical protein